MVLSIIITLKNKSIMTTKTLKALSLAFTAALFSVVLLTSCKDEKKTTETEINSTEMKTEPMDTTGKTKPVKGGSITSDATETPSN